MPFLVLKQNISITRALKCRLHQNGKIDESPWERTSSAWKSSALLLILNHFLTNVFGQKSLNKKNRVSNANPRNQMQMNLKRACISQTLLFFEFSSLIVGTKLTTSCSFLCPETKPLNYSDNLFLLSINTPPFRGYAHTPNCRLWKSEDKFIHRDRTTLISVDFHLLVYVSLFIQIKKKGGKNVLWWW